MKIRPAIAKDLKCIKALVAKYPKQLVQTNLPKRKDFFVAEHLGKVMPVALWKFIPSVWQRSGAWW